jgi:hypothetical protein
MNDTSGQENLFGVTELVSTPESVYAVKVSNLSEFNSGSSGGTNAVIVSNSIVSYGNTNNLTTAFSLGYGIFPVDPSTNVAWIYTSVNSADVGVIVN